MAQLQRVHNVPAGLTMANYHDAIMDGLRSNGERMSEVAGSVNKLAQDFTLFRNEDWVRLMVDFGRLSGRVDHHQEKLEAHVSETKNSLGHWITLGIALAGVLASALMAHVGKH